MRFAKFLEVPVEEIKDSPSSISVKNDNFTFNDNSINTQYVNIPQNIFDIIIKYNQKLEEINIEQKIVLEKLEEENQTLKNQLNK